MLVYADLARWEIAAAASPRTRSRNLGVDEPDASAPGCSTSAASSSTGARPTGWKRPLIDRVRLRCSTRTTARAPKLVAGDDVPARPRATRRRGRSAWCRSSTPAPWGGQWMKEVCDLDRATRRTTPGASTACPRRTACCSASAATRVEMPSIDLVFHQPRALLGEAVHARFGDEFPIRFDFLDTMGGGQPLAPGAPAHRVHPGPLRDALHAGRELLPARRRRRTPACTSACRRASTARRWSRDLRARAGGRAAVPRRALREPLAGEEARPLPDPRRHRPLLGRERDGARDQRDAVHLHVQAVGLGPAGPRRPAAADPPRPRRRQHPVGPDDRAGCERKLVNRDRAARRAATGWREERTGLHEREFIETRRHWFTGPVPHDTGGGVNVLNLVEGEEAVVESPAGAFEPFVVHYAETFIVPAAVGPYTIRPHGRGRGDGVRDDQGGGTDGSENCRTENVERRTENGERRRRGCCQFSF